MRHLLLLVLACLFLGMPAWAMTIDLNTATQADLETLPGIGPAKASAILEWRSANGPFTTPAQLDEVPGIGPATLSRLLPLVSIGGARADTTGGGDASTTTSAPAPAPSGDLGLVIQAAPDQLEQPGPSQALVEPAPQSGRIDINTASADQLMALPGIGASKAALIVASRSQQGPFASCADLQRINGIGAKTVENLEAMCTTGGAAPTSSPRAPSSSGRVPAAPSGSLVDINSATTAQLDALPGIGPSKAAAIVADRDQNGPFASCADLQRVTGIGATTVANLEHLCTAR